MTARRRPRLVALLPAAVLAPAALVLLPGPSAAQDDLQSRWSQSVDTVLMSALPAEVIARLTAVPSAQPVTFALSLPSGPVVVPAEAERDDGLRTWSSAVTFSVPSGTPCGTYTLTATLAPRSEVAALPTAGGTVAVVGCPPALEVSPLDEVRTGPTLPWSFRGRHLPEAAVGGRLLVAGAQVGHDLTSTSLFTTAELALGCGNTDVQVVARTGEVLEARTARLRCPSASLEPDAVDRTALPLEVPLHVRELASDTPFEVRLDGELVTSATTDVTGAARVGVPVPRRAACGTHQVVVRQALAPVPVLPPYPEPDPEPEPKSQPEPELKPEPEPEPEREPERSAPPTLAPATVGPELVLRAAMQDVPAAARTAEVTVPITVRCPQTPTLEVTPPVRADNGLPVTYDVRGSGFGDDADVELSAGGDVVASARADDLGALAAQLALRLPCGSTTFTARDAAGSTAQDAVEVRCPSVGLDPATVAAADLPRGVSARASGFDDRAPLTVLLDGEPVEDATADDLGTAVVPLRARASLACGPHEVTVRQGADPAPQARATLTVTCPPPAVPVLDVAPEVVPDGHVLRVTGERLPPGELRLVWRLRDGTRLPALRRPVTATNGRLDLGLLVLRGEPAGPRQLLAVGGDAVVGDAGRTLVVLDSVQPGRAPGSGTVLLGRR